MNGPVSLPPLQALTLSPRLAGQLALRPDTLIQATITRIQGETVTLNVQGHPLQARSEIPLAPGQRLNFLVQFSGNQWRLIPQPLTSAAPATVTSPAPLQSLTAPPVQALQTVLNQLFQSLPATQPGPALAALAEKVQQQLLRPEKRLGTEQLRTHLLNGGTQLEARLASGQPVAQDLKATLLQMLALAKEQKKEALIDPLRKLLRRIEHHQARSLMEGAFSFPLLFEPRSDIRDGSLTFYPPAPDEKPPVWRALLQLDMSRTGPFEALITLTPQSLQVIIWSADPSVREALASLGERLRELADQVKVTWHDTPPSSRLQSTALSVRAEA